MPGFSKVSKTDLPEQAVTAVAHANIALVKYWGKRDDQLNLPATGSISLTLKELFTRTRVRFLASLPKDRVTINGQTAEGEEWERVHQFLQLIRELANIDWAAEVVTENNFPTGAGLASSASAFAALALAASQAAGLSLNKTELSVLARRGSGSAARSIFGGFVEMLPGQKPDGSDAHAVQIADENFWDLRLIIAITSEAPKAISSREAMIRSRELSPYFHAWVKSNPADIAEMRQAILARQFEKVGEIAELNCLKMHSVIFSTPPGIIYWNSTTVELLHQVRTLRKSGIPAYFTIDAGPQVKVLTLPEYQQKIMEVLKQIEGVVSVVPSAPGPDAYLEENSRK